MFRTLLTLAFLGISAAVIAAPAPAPSEKEVLAKHWGKPEGDGEFEIKGKQLTIRSFGKPTGGVMHGMNMPRASRTVTGDFEATLKILDVSLPKKDGQHTGAWPNTRAGLLVQGGGYAIELHLFQYYPKANNMIEEKPTRCIWFDTWYPQGGSGRTLRAAESGKSVYLRITRKDKKVTATYSFDGEEWSKPQKPSQELDFPDEITVGVFFSHSTTQIADANFDSITITKPK